MVFQDTYTDLVSRIYSNVVRSWITVTVSVVRLEVVTVVYDLFGKKT